MKKARQIMTLENVSILEVDADVLVLRRSHLKVSQKKSHFGHQSQKQPTGKPICKNKIRYRDRQEAIEALHRIQKVRGYKAGTAAGEARRENRTYNCPTCLGAHLSSKAMLADPILKLVETPAGVVEKWELANVA